MLFLEASSADAAAGAGITIVYGVFGLIFLAIHIFVIVDILKHSDGAWERSGQNKTLWLVLWLVSFCCGGIILDAIYWFAIRPKLVAVETA